MTILYWLDRIQPSDRLLVGEKAFLLSQLKRQGYPILPGFAIATTTFQTFLEHLEDTDSLLADFPHSSLYLDVNNHKALQLVAQQSSQAILRASLPSQWLSTLVEATEQFPSPALIWRFSLSLPSLSLSLQGLFPSQTSWKTPEALELALKTCWAALFSAKSLFYWQQVGTAIEKVKLAILVQPLTDATASGTAFVQPNHFHIQATWGLGHTLIKGEVLPDTYELDRSFGLVETKRTGNKSRAYHVNTHFKDSNSLDVRLLDPVAQETFSLDELPLKQLYQLLQRLTIEIPELTTIEWLLTADSEAQIYLLQCNLALNAPATTPTTSKPLLKGLAAAPGVVVAPTQVIAQQDSQPVEIVAGSILVASIVQLDWLPSLKTVAGLIVEQGGITSHAAIIARELGIPAIVGATTATKVLKTGDSILLNGNTGMVYQANHQPSPTPIRQPSPMKIAYPISTQLMVNLSQPSKIAQIASLPVDGVGLLRSEWLMSELLSYQPLSFWLQGSQRSHFVEKLVHLVSEFTRAFAPRPVFYRSFDGTNRSQRGTYGYMVDPTLFELELQALQQVQIEGNSNINLILPFVRSVEEFSFCRERVEQAQLMLSPTFQLWMMAEVPSVIFLLPEYVKAGVQGIAIGTNDLSQLLLGIEREQTSHSERLNASHPAMLAALKQLIQLSKTLDIPCSICGQAPVQYPTLIDDLIRWGITAISVEPEAVLRTHEAIARAEHRLCLEAARGLIQLPPKSPNPGGL